MPRGWHLQGLAKYMECGKCLINCCLVTGWMLLVLYPFIQMTWATSIQQTFIEHLLWNRNLESPRKKEVSSQLQQRLSVPMSTSPWGAHFLTKPLAPYWQHMWLSGFGLSLVSRADSACAQGRLEVWWASASGGVFLNYCRMEVRA